MNVDRMLRQISIRQLSEWRAYADLEPFDEERADLRAAQIVQAVHALRLKKIPKLKDCVLPFGEQPRRQPRTAEEARRQVRNAMTVLVAMNSTPEKGRER